MKVCERKPCLFLKKELFDDEDRILLLFTTCKRSLGQGDVFTPVCQSLCSQWPPKQAVRIQLECILFSNFIRSTGGYMFFLGAVEWLGPHRDRFEDKMRELETKRIWKWIATKQSDKPYYLDHQTLIYMFQV